MKMKKQLLTMWLLLGMVSFPMMAISIAQEAEEVEMEEVGGFAYGNVVSVSSNKIVLNEYDYDNEKSSQVTYLINSETKFINVESYAEIMNGDDVEIDFKESEGIKIAVIIKKEAPWSPEDNTNYEDDQSEEYQEEYIDDSSDENRG